MYVRNRRWWLAWRKCPFVMRYTKLHLVRSCMGVNVGLKSTRLLLVLLWVSRWCVFPQGSFDRCVVYAQEFGGGGFDAGWWLVESMQ